MKNEMDGVGQLEARGFVLVKKTDNLLTFDNVLLNERLDFNLKDKSYLLYNRSDKTAIKVRWRTQKAINALFAEVEYRCYDNPLIYIYKKFKVDRRQVVANTGLSMTTIMRLEKGCSPGETTEDLLLVYLEKLEGKDE